MINNTLFVPWLTGSLNVLDDKWKRSRNRKVWEEAFLIARPTWGEAQPGQKRKVKIERGGEMLDYDNLTGGCKPILDALRMMRILIDDSREFVSPHYSQPEELLGKNVTAITVE